MSLVANVADSDAAIRSLIRDSEANQGDVDTFSGLLTEDVVVVNIAGRRVFGRERFRAAMGQAMAGQLARVRTTTEIVDIRHATPGIAVVSCIKHVFDETDHGLGLPATGTLTYLVIETASGWRIALAQTTPRVD